MDELISRLESAGLVDELGNIILERYGGGYQAVDQSTFKAMFGAAIESAHADKGSESGADLHSALASADEDRGYLRFFDIWREKGII
jgi:hypothetical protein